jgi:4'-phosphopantetheinyl transferase
LVCGTPAILNLAPARSGDRMFDIRQSDVHLWWLETQSLSEDVIASTDEILSPDERIRRDRFRFPSDRRDFALAHDLLRRSLSIYIATFKSVSPSDWRFKADAFGKPTIDSDDPNLSRLSFSLTHTRGLVACGVTLDAPLGVDVERANQSFDIMEIARAHYSATEAASIEALSPDRRRTRFTELWTLKEAYLKAIGTGLSGSLSSAAFAFEQPNTILFEIEGVRQPNWRFALIELDSISRLAVAMRWDASVNFVVFHDRRPSTRGEHRSGNLSHWLPE